MQDPVKTIKDLIYAGWDLAGVLTKTKMAWCYGPPSDPTARFKDYGFSLEFDDMTEPRRKKTLSRNRAQRIVTVDFWIKMRPDSNRETLRGYKQQFIDEVDSIVEAGERSATGLNFIYVGNGGRNLDEIEENVMRVQMEIVCVHQK